MRHLEHLSKWFVVVAVVAVILIEQALFIVDEREQALVLQFGAPVKIVREAGLNMKLPFIQQVEFFDKRILEIDPDPERVILSSSKGGLMAAIRQTTAVEPITIDGEETTETTEPAEPAEPLVETAADRSRRQSNNASLTSGEPIIVDTFARYKITDPLKFRQRLRTESAAVLRLQNEMDSTTRDVLGRATLEELLSPKRSELMRDIRARVNATVANLGLEIVDIRIGRADLVDNLKQATFNRMRSEREQQATQTRSRGQERALEIRSEADKQRAVIIAEAQRESNIIRGEADKKATTIYASAFEQDAEFYGFYRSLEAYRKGLISEDKMLVISPESDFFRYFNRVGP